MRACIYLLSTLLLIIVCGAHAVDLPAGIKPAKRTQDFPWMSVATWERMHAEDALVAKYDAVEVLFIGDSITAGWDSSLWQQYFAPLNAANFGIAGDHTGNMLWRLQHGAIGNLKPKLVILLAGVNNFGHLRETPEQIAQGVASVVTQLRLAWPESRILLNGVFPFEESAKSPRRQQVKELNALLANLDDNQRVFFKDYGSLFLAPDGNIPAALMGDFLHPTTEGYEVWANAMLPDIQRLLRF